MLSRMREI
jgi:hypothetical protein